MNTLNIQPISLRALQQWWLSFSSRLKTSNTVSASHTTSTKRPRSLASATSAYTKSAGAMKLTTARMVLEVLSLYLGPSSTGSSNKPETQRISIYLKPKLWHAQFGAEKAHFELHIKEKPLTVRRVNATTITCTDQTGESWMVFPEWVARIEAAGKVVWPVEPGFISLSKPEASS